MVENEWKIIMAYMECIMKCAKKAMANLVRFLQHVEKNVENKEHKK
jgi:hypothetical protein